MIYGGVNHHPLNPPPSNPPLSDPFNDRPTAVAVPVSVKRHLVAAICDALLLPSGGGGLPVSPLFIIIADYAYFTSGQLRTIPYRGNETDQTQPLGITRFPLRRPTLSSPVPRDDKIDSDGDGDSDGAGEVLIVSCLSNLSIYYPSSSPGGDGGDGGERFKMLDCSYGDFQHVAFDPFWAVRGRGGGCVVVRRDSIHTLPIYDWLEIPSPPPPLPLPPPPPSVASTTPAAPATPVPVPVPVLPSMSVLALSELYSHATHALVTADGCTVYVSCQGIHSLMKIDRSERVKTVLHRTSTPTTPATNTHKAKPPSPAPAPAPAPALSVAVDSLPPLTMKSVNGPTATGSDRQLVASSHGTDSEYSVFGVG